MLQKATMLKVLTLMTAAFYASVASATSLSVTPTKVEVASGNAQTTMTIKSEGRGGSVVQLRIFKWKEGQHPSRLRETRDVVISPPMAQIKGRQELTARIVRRSTRKIRGRECYRVLVDRLPDNQRRASEISLRIRHSVPVCFTG
ncbi:molecular chaperone [Sulfitobacter sp. S190]|uniref:fimbrial biogenesis chaperone n=1 Tax=Sulfitobacter sp. S190 TaxID=2867022 RepID=UPI0021A8309D|nr:fimbria/pilus periplasmic chaperone [Sulfitobacter sp. S190]UWR24301.1 fimbria/pilus periplasmic chaperone [Sulfitobacter sp. S190]